VVQTPCLESLSSRDVEESVDASIHTRWCQLATNYLVERVAMVEADNDLSTHFGLWNKPIRQSFPPVSWFRRPASSHYPRGTSKSRWTHLFTPVAPCHSSTDYDNCRSLFPSSTFRFHRGQWSLHASVIDQYRGSDALPRVIILEGRRRVGGRIYSHPLHSLKSEIETSRIL
jgi:hypothetical protein